MKQSLQAAAACQQANRIAPALASDEKSEIKYPHLQQVFKASCRTRELSGQQPVTSEGRAAELGAAGLASDTRDTLRPNAGAKPLSHSSVSRHRHPPKLGGRLKQPLFPAVFSR